MSCFLTPEQMAVAIANHTMTPPPWWNPFLSPDMSILTSPQYIQFSNQQELNYDRLHPTKYGNDDTPAWDGTSQNSNATYSNSSLNVNAVG